LGDKTKGEAIVAGMNLMGYHVMALGPHELALGQEVLRQRMAEAEFPMVSANVVLSETGELFAEPYVILETGGRRVGIIGLTRVPDKPLAGFQVLDPRTAAAQYVPEVVEQSDTVVILTNVSYPAALALASQVPNIDLLVAGRAKQRPTQAVRIPGTGTLTVTTEPPLQRHTGREVGRLVVTLESDGTLTEESWNPVPLTKETPDDPVMTKLLNTFRQ
jgi:2',3'-cyclic-nucleotide 2'-phosphodiesterase (5'-nucleotidase family)